VRDDVGQSVSHGGPTDGRQLDVNAASWDPPGRRCPGRRSRSTEWAGAVAKRNRRRQKSMYTMPLSSSGSVQLARSPQRPPSEIRDTDSQLQIGVTMGVTVDAGILAHICRARLLQCRARRQLT